jgi:hypothetical protein
VKSFKVPNCCSCLGISGTRQKARTGSPAAFISYPAVFLACALIFFQRSLAARLILALAAAECLPTLRTSFSTLPPNAEAAARTLLN